MILYIRSRQHESPKVHSSSTVRANDWLFYVTSCRLAARGEHVSTTASSPELWWRPRGWMCNIFPDWAFNDLASVFKLFWYICLYLLDCLLVCFVTDCSSSDVSVNSLRLIKLCDILRNMHSYLHSDPLLPAPFSCTLPIHWNNGYFWYMVNYLFSLTIASLL